MHIRFGTLDDMKIHLVDATMGLAVRDISETQPTESFCTKLYLSDFDTYGDFTKHPGVPLLVVEDTLEEFMDTTTANLGIQRDMGHEYTNLVTFVVSNPQNGISVSPHFATPLSEINDSKYNRMTPDMVGWLAMAGF